MGSINALRLRVTIWPFLFFLPGFVIFATYLLNQQGYGVPSALLYSLALGVLSVGLSASAAVVWAKIFPRLAWGFWGPILGYSIAVAAGEMGLFAIVPLLPISIAPLFLAFLLFGVGRIAAVVIIAIIIEGVTEGVRSFRRSRKVIAVRVEQTKYANNLLSGAEARVREDSARRIEEDVLPRMGDILRDGPKLSDADLADIVDSFIDGNLRPLSHRLHPVNVRLGLGPAIRGLCPRNRVEFSPELERMDLDGELLDEDVRLQVYRWIRDSTRRASKKTVIAVGVRDRRLWVEVSDTDVAELDVIQLLAGLALEGQQAVSAPLKGQALAPRMLFPEPASLSPVQSTERIKVAEIMTTPLPRPLVLVGILVVGSVFSQLAVAEWSSPAVLVSGIAAWTAAALGITALMAALPKPRATPLGAFLAIGQWGLVGLGAAFAFTLVTTLAGSRLSLETALAVDVFRGIYRFTLPGLFLVLANGLVTTSRRSLNSSRDSLVKERQRQAELLQTARRTDRDVAEALHRTVQARLAAVVIMLRIGQRDEAWNLLVTIAVTTLPSLLARMESGDPARFAVVGEVPPGLYVEERLNIFEPLPRELAQDLRRAVSEACVNSMRHGGATKAQVTVRDEPGGYGVLILDNGRGFIGDPGVGLGSRVLSEVVDKWGGCWNIISPETGGCLVTLEVRNEIRLEVDAAPALLEVSTGGEK